MSILELLLMGVGLAMDAFAVSIGKGLAMKQVNKKQCFIIALYFGGFQAMMPLIGWALGSQFASKIQAVDHWIAFVLLAYIGGKMITDAIKDKREEMELCGADGEIRIREEEMDLPLNHREMVIMAIATSIDALAVGVTFSFFSVNIVEAISIIGAVTFLICIAGVFIGNLFGLKYKYRAAFAGGLILIILGCKILLTDLFF